MNFERVIGLITLYAVIARNEYANIMTPVASSLSRNCTTGDSTRRSQLLLMFVAGRPSLCRPAGRVQRVLARELATAGAGSVC